MKRADSQGFTLVEMMIALAIFGMLTAAAVTLLSVTARTRETSERRLAELGEVRRLGALLTADLAQAAPRSFRDQAGRRRPAFAGAAGDAAMLMVFVRRGWDAGEGGALQRVAYRLRDGRLERLGNPRIDGAADGAAVALLDGVRRLRLRYRDEDGAWRDRWDPTDRGELPVAVELVTDSDDHGMVRQLFLVGTGR
jgi:general secretion pathway protein J